MFWKHQKAQWSGRGKDDPAEHLLPSQLTHLLSLITLPQLESFIPGSMFTSRSSIQCSRGRDLKDHLIQLISQVRKGGPKRTKSHSLCVAGLPTPKTEFLPRPHTATFNFDGHCNGRLTWKVEGVESRPRNRVIRLTHTKQKWATDACQTPASCLSPTWARQRQVAGPTSPRRKHRGKRGGDPHSLCWKERWSPSAGGCPHQRAQGVVNLSLSCGIWPVGQERKRERKAERELPPETTDAPLTYILCTRHPRNLGSCLLFWYPWFPHTPPPKKGYGEYVGENGLHVSKEVCQHDSQLRSCRIRLRVYSDWGAEELPPGRWGERGHVRGKG